MKKLFIFFLVVFTTMGFCKTMTSTNYTLNNVTISQGTQQSSTNFILKTSVGEGLQNTVPLASTNYSWQTGFLATWVDAYSYDFTLYYSNTCTLNKGAIIGTACIRVWLETAETIPPINDTSVLPDGQGENQPIMTMDFTGNAPSFDTNISLGSALPTGLVLKANSSDDYFDAKTITTVSQALTINTIPSGTQDLNIWWYGDFVNYDTRNGLDVNRTLDINGSG